MYHVTAATGQQVATDLVLEVDLLGEEQTARKIDKLFHLHRAALKRDTIADYWKRQAATAPESLAPMLLTAPVLDAIRKEVRRTTGFNPDPAAISAALESGVIRPELV